MLEVCSLSHSLMQAWENYETQMLFTQKKLSKKNVHQLRISTQRLEAVLKLTKAATETNKAEKLIQEVKNTRRMLSTLRDLQVETKTIKKLRPEKATLFHKEIYLNFLSRKIKKSKKESTKAITTVSLKQHRKILDTIESELFFSDAEYGSHNIEMSLSKILQITKAKYKKTLRSTKASDIKRFHKLRVKSKKLRYQAEALKGILDLKSIKVNKLKSIQKKTGEILDRRLLLKALEKFLHKRHLNTSEVKEELKKIDYGQIKLSCKEVDKLKLLNAS